MKISLFQTILFGAFGVAALLGLFVFATYTTKSTSNAVGSVVIWGTLPAEGVQAALTTSAQTDQSLKNVSYVEKDAATLTADLATAIATGNSPDLILASQEELSTLSKFISPIPLASLPSSAFSSTFIEEGELFVVPGELGYYGIPLVIDPLVLFSNRAILSTNGIPQPPATWEALTGLVPKVSVLTPSRQIVRGLVALGTYDNVHNARGILSSLFLQTGVPISSYTPGGVLSANLGVGTGSSPGQAVLGFYTQFTDPSKVSYTWNASLRDSQQAFLAGDLALYIGFASEARFLAAANPNLDLGVAILPQPATANFKTTYGLVYALMVPRGARNAAGAYQAAVILTNPIEQGALAASTGLAPAVLSQLSAAPASPSASIAYAEALYAKGWLSPAPATTDSVFSGMIGSVISGRSPLETALANAERSLSAYLQQ